MKLSTGNSGEESGVQSVPRAKNSEGGAIPLSFLADASEESTEWG